MKYAKHGCENTKPKISGGAFFDETGMLSGWHARIAQMALGRISKFLCLTNRAVYLVDYRHGAESLMPLTMAHNIFARRQNYLPAG